jgi:hypothetical protein
VSRRVRLRARLPASGSRPPGHDRGRGDHGDTGVSTLYIQTAGSGDGQALADAGLLGGFIDEAHRRGLNVVGWYAPSFTDPARDWGRTTAALNLSSTTGGFDGFALDIESKLSTTCPFDRRAC